MISTGIGQLMRRRKREVRVLVEVSISEVNEDGYGPIWLAGERLWGMSFTGPPY
jgi:hypothetical protein